MGALTKVTTETRTSSAVVLCLLVSALLSDRCSITLKVAKASMSFFTSFHQSSANSQ